MEFKNSDSGPSTLAIWLITIFGSADEGQAALGDLLEEFSLLVPVVGISAAKRWFWRQTPKTIGYLIGRQFRTSPVAVAAPAIGGFLLRWYVSRLSNPTLKSGIHALLQHYRIYELDPHLYIFWTIHTMYAERFLVNVLTGITVAV